MIILITFYGMLDSRAGSAVDYKSKDLQVCRSVELASLFWVTTCSSLLHLSLVTNIAIVTLRYPEVPYSIQNQERSHFISDQPERRSGQGKLPRRLGVFGFNKNGVLDQSQMLLATKLKSWLVAYES